MTDKNVVGKIENLSVDFSDLKKTINDIEEKYSTKDKEDKKGLCFRCEHRASFLETGRQPRFECGQIEQCNHGCYMYKPVKPVILAMIDGDKRPQFGPSMISARSQYAGEPDMILNVKKVENSSILYWTPKD